MKYLKLIKLFLNISIKQTLVYRMTAVMIFSFSTLFLIAEVLGVTIFFEFTDMIAGWDKSKFLFLLATATLIQNIYQFFFILQHEEFSDNIIEGELDYILLRPINSKFYTSFRLFDIPSLLNMLVPLGIIVYVADSIVWSVQNIILYTIYLIIGVVQYYLINHFLVCLAFWVEKTDKLSGLPEYLFDFATKPREIYPKYIQVTLGYLVPMLLMTNLPVNIIYNDVNVGMLIYSLVITIILQIIVGIEWTKGLKKYQSSN